MQLYVVPSSNTIVEKKYVYRKQYHVAISFEQNTRIYMCIATYSATRNC